MRRVVFFFAWALPVALIPSCGTTPTDQQSYQYQIPQGTGDGWEVASLAEAGLGEGPFVQLMNDLQQMEGHRIHSLLVARQGRLVFEEYFDGQKFNLAQYTGGTGFGRDDAHNLASVTKSFTTTLVGMAIDQGHIPSVGVPVFDYFPEHADLVAEDPRRGEMTVEHLLLMTSGLRWNDLETYSYDDPRNDLIQMWGSEDPIRYALSRDMEAVPGTNFEYCNANTNILGEIVGRATGLRLDLFSGQYLFAPLGIETFEWQMMPNDIVFASGDLRLRPRDMAKLGQVFLDVGWWREEQVVSEEWVESATERRIGPDGPHDWADGYGYGWWHWDLYSGGELYQTYQASGWGGQWIVVLPEHQTVVVTTGGNYFHGESMPIQKILTEYLFPALD